MFRSIALLSFFLALAIACTKKAAVSSSPPLNQASASSQFQATCQVCHGEFGQGGIGPNLTDNYWLHGASKADIINSIAHGIPEKGMISWKSQLTNAQIDGLADYIIGLHGSKPASPKKEQGKFYSDEELKKLRSSN